MGMYRYIQEKCQALVKKYHTRDPFVLADELGVIVKYSSRLRDLKGMYTVVKRSRFIFLNANMDENMTRIVLAHELGHDQLHRNLTQRSVFREFALYHMTSRPEYEANIFASHILLKDETLLNYIRMGYDNVQIAALTDTDINLVALKSFALMQQGYELRVQEYRPDFLKTRE